MAPSDPKGPWQLSSSYRPIGGMAQCSQPAQYLYSLVWYTQSQNEYKAATVCDTNL